MNQQIKWYYLVIGGLLAHFVPTLVGGDPITYGIGIVGDLCFLLGIVEWIRSAMKAKKGHTDPNKSQQ